MKLKNSFLLFLGFMGSLGQLHAVELSGRLAGSTNLSQAEAGELGYFPGNFTDKSDTINSNQQSVRLMLNESGAQAFSWELHGKLLRQNVNRLSSGSGLGNGLTKEVFRYKALSNLEELSEADSSQEDKKDELFIYELDRAVLAYQFKKTDFSLGRQAIEWGAGRFWQPMNVFGAFSPTALDTDYKGGIDSARLSYYPSSFSSLDLVVAAATEDSSAANQEYKESFASVYRQQLNGLGELSFLLGEVLDNNTLGVSLESEWQGIGLRFEGVQYEMDIDDERYLFFIAGLDYYFSDYFTNGFLLTVEYYQNELGAEKQSELSAQFVNPLLLNGIQQHLGEQVLGLSLNRDVSPLLNMNYSLLGSQLQNIEGSNKSSFLHQINFSYSLANNADFLVSFLMGNGAKLNLLGLPQSEFGHVPDTLSLRLRYYF
jgi:hypothetical protein